MIKNYITILSAFAVSDNQLNLIQNPVTNYKPTRSHYPEDHNKSTSNLTQLDI